MFYLFSLPPPHRRKDHLVNDGLAYANTLPFPKEASIPVPMVTKTPWWFLRAEARPNIPSWWSASEYEYLNADGFGNFVIPISSCQWGGVLYCLT